MGGELRGQQRTDGSQKMNGGDIVATTLGIQMGTSRFFCSNSEPFDLLERIFNLGRPHLTLVTNSEKKAMQRLMKAGLVTSEKVTCRHDCCGENIRTRYSLTLAGKANYVAAELGLSFPQLCYLAYARMAARSSIFGRDSAFFVKDLNPVFNALFQDVSPSMTRKALTRKGFLVKCVRRVSAMTPRIAEVEKYSAVTDELCLWMKSEYRTRFLESMQNPLVARMVCKMTSPLMPDERASN